VQLDEKWSFVGKKQKHCDEQDPREHTRGDCWDHVAFDPESRLVLQLLVGKRSGTRVLHLLKALREQLQGRVPRLITSDNFAPYATCIELVFGRPRRPRPSGQGKKRPAPESASAQLTYATVRKHRRQGRVVSVESKVIFGSEASLAGALKASECSTAVNTSFIERHNATDRHRNARKGRRTYRFSKDWQVHAAMSCFTNYSYNFCWPVRTLRRKIGKKRYEKRTPAMAAGLTDHVWPLSEWLAIPVLMHSG